MSKLTKMIETLEAAGIDTSQFTVVLGDGTKIAPNGNYVEDVQLENKTFRRWITAQTFRMLYEPSYNTKTHRTEHEWYNYIKNNYDYMYQFKVISDELRILEKLERKDKEAFEERKCFFTREVIVETCWDCCYKLLKNRHNIPDDLRTTFNAIQLSKAYKDMRKYFHMFYTIANRYKYYMKGWTKCSAWLDAYKGSGAYYSLQNMILYHECRLPGFSVGKEKNYKILQGMLQQYASKGEVWRMHDLLKQTINFNQFNLAESIQKYQ